MKIINLTNIDQNFEIRSALPEKDIVFLDARQKPFNVYGLYNCMNKDGYCRIPEEVASRVN